MWRRFGAALVLFLNTGSALATPAAPPLPGACLDPSKPYRAKWVSGRDIIVTASTGKQRSEVRITTDCISLDGNGRISVTSGGACLATGDPVVIRRAGEPAQTCKVKAIAPNGAPS
jgi:hypothetical protein